MLLLSIAHPRLFTSVLLVSGFCQAFLPCRLRSGAEVTLPRHSLHCACSIPFLVIAVKPRAWKQHVSQRWADRLPNTTTTRKAGNAKHFLAEPYPHPNKYSNGKHTPLPLAWKFTRIILWVHSAFWCVFTQMQFRLRLLQGRGLIVRLVLFKPASSSPQSSLHFHI